MSTSISSIEFDSKTASTSDCIDSNDALSTIDDAAPNGENAPYTLRRGNDHLKTFVSMTGNVLEWYDFAVFGYFSDIIGKVFFPPQSGNTQTIESFAVFWGAFLMRPGECK